MSVFPEVFDVLGAPESWPPYVIDAVCRPLSSETVKILSAYNFERKLTRDLLLRLLTDLPFQSVPQETLENAKGLHEVWRAARDITSTRD